MFVGVVMVAILALMLVFLQQQFNEGDHRKALALLASKAPGAKWSVGEELLKRAGNTSPDCQPKITSSFRGTVEVRCIAGPGGPYRFAVDLVRKTVQPIDFRARELMETAALAGK